MNSDRKQRQHSRNFFVKDVDRVVLHAYIASTDILKQKKIMQERTLMVLF